MVDGSATFISGTVFLDRSNEEEQRVCILLENQIDPAELKSMEKPFGTIHLDNPIRVGNIPINHLKVFLLSGSIKARYIDLVISPKKDKLDPLLRPSL